MVSAQFLVVLDASIVNVALPTIQRSLGFSAVGLEGVITAYTAAFGGALILGGRLADRFGRRRMLAAGLAAFGLTSLACALASSPAFLVTARVSQGLSAAVLAPAALSLVLTTFAEGPPRNRALGVFGIASSLGFVTGQVLGGILADSAGWRSVFLINLPIVAVALAMTFRVLAADPRPSSRRAPHVTDAVLVTAGIALLVWAPARGAERGWRSAEFLVPLAVSLVLLTVFGVAEARHPDPLIRLSLLRSRWAAGATITTVLTGILNGTTLLVVTLILQQVRGYSPLLAGLALIPFGLAGLVAGVGVAGRLVTRLGARLVLAGTGLVSAVMVAGLSQLPEHGSYLALVPWLIGAGASFTTGVVAVTVAASAGIIPGEQGMSAGIRQTSFQLGIALGAAVLLSVAASRTSAILLQSPTVNAPAALMAGFRLTLHILTAAAAAAAVIAWAMLRRDPGDGDQG